MEITFLSLFFLPDAIPFSGPSYADQSSGKLSGIWEWG